MRKLYLAGAFPEGLYRFHNDPAYMYRKPWKKYKPGRGIGYLESYYEVQNKDSMLDVIRREGYSLFMDSGSYSAFTKGVDLNLKEYADFLKRHSDIIHIAAATDVIGKGNEQATYDNLKELESYGVKVQPTFHVGDEDKWLIRYIEEGYKYIFLGGLVPVSAPQKELWLDRVYGEFICNNKKGKPIVDTHLFGLTHEKLMQKYPCTSVDSTSFKMYAIMSFIILPTKNRQLQSLAISEKAPSRKQLGRHYNHLSKREKDYVKRIVGGYGFTPKKLSRCGASRSVLNAMVYSDFVKKTKFPKRFINTRRGLFV